MAGSRLNARSVVAATPRVATATSAAVGPIRAEEADLSTLHVPSLAAKPARKRGVRHPHRSIWIETGIYQMVRTGDDGIPVPVCWRVVVSCPNPKTGKSGTRSDRFPLDTPIETLRSIRDDWKHQAALEWAPILAERQRAKEAKGRAPRFRKRVRRNIYRCKTGYRVEWSAPNPETGKRAYPRPHQWFPGNPTIESLERFRDARERDAKRAWAQLREERHRETRQRALERRRERQVTLETNIAERFRRSDGRSLGFRVWGYDDRKRKRSYKDLPPGTPLEELRRWRDEHLSARAATFGQRLQRLRLECGWSREALAERVGEHLARDDSRAFSPATVLRHEKDRQSPHLKAVRAYAAVFTEALRKRITLADLLGKARSRRE